MTPNVEPHPNAAAGPLLMLAAALLFTGLNIIIKFMSAEYRVWDIGFYRFFGGMLMLVLVFNRGRNPYRGHNTRLLIIRGCTGSVAFVSLLTAIKLLPVSTALVLFYTFPAFAAVISAVLFKEKLSTIGAVCIAMVLAGMAVFFDLRFTGSIVGQLLAINAAVFAGITVTLIRELKFKNGPAIIYLYFCTMGLLVVLPFYLAAPVVPDSPREWLMVAGVVFCSLTAQLLMNQGFSFCRGWEGGVFMTSEVIFTALIGIVFLDDPATWRFWIGGLSIVGSVVVLNVHNLRGRPSHGTHR